MNESELIAGARRELARNIAIAPIVLCLRLPMGLSYMVLSLVTDALEWAGTRIPGWRTDWAYALRRHRFEASLPTIVREKTPSPKEPTP